MLSVIFGVVCLTWYLIVFVVSVAGYIQLLRFYRKPRDVSVSQSLPLSQVPHVTIIRPVKGLEPNLYECLVASFQQSYPPSRLTVYFCISTREDPGYQVIEQVVAKYPSFDVKVFVEEEDPFLQLDAVKKLGPNPKIRNMSRAYREAKGDIIWIVDCNAWFGKGVAGRLVDVLCGFGRNGPNRPYKICHQLPVVVDVTGNLDGNSEEYESLNANGRPNNFHVASTSTAAYATEAFATSSSKSSLLGNVLQRGGSRLEELFLSSAHAKLYTGINTILVAPCMVGKSTMFRKSHLNSLTSPENSQDGVGPGIDYFSYNICEDHLVGDLLWKKRVPEENTPVPSGLSLGKHALLFGDLAIQPMARMSIGEYIARRVRWLRVRKYTVTLATLVEPGTECFLCCFYGAFAFTSLPFLYGTVGINPTWTNLALLWILNVTCWIVADRFLYVILSSMGSIELDEDTPAFIKPQPEGRSCVRPFKAWFLAWLGREVLAFPIWLWAVFGGATVVWRGQKFRVGMDTRVTAITEQRKPTGWHEGNGNDNGSKARVE